MSNLIIYIVLILVAMVFSLSVVLKKENKYTDLIIGIIIFSTIIGIFGIIILTFIPNMQGSFKSDYDKCNEKYFIENKRKFTTFDGVEKYYIKFRTGKEVETTETFYRIAVPYEYIHNKKNCNFI